MNISLYRVNYYLLTKETYQQRKERFKTMSSMERKALIRSKMKAEGLEEGSGVSGVVYDEDEIRTLIMITSRFSEF